MRELALPPERIWRAMERGVPTNVILDCAAKTDAELIVLGKHAAGIVNARGAMSSSYREGLRSLCQIR